MKIPSPVSGRTRPVDQPLALVRDDGISARAMGALSIPPETGLGQAFGNLAQAFSNVARRYEAVQRTKVTTGLSELNAQLAIDLNEQRRQTPLDETNAYEKQLGYIDKTVSEFIEKRIPPELRDEFAPRVEELRNRFRLDSYNWGRSQEDAYFRKSISDAETQAVNNFVNGAWTREEAERHLEDIINVTDLPEIEKNAERLRLQLKIASLDYGRAIEAEMRAGNVSAANLIRGFEGYEASAYEDRNAETGESAGYRVGYGSDKVVRTDGTIETVTADTKITKAEAEATLQYRLTREFEPKVRDQVGVDVWTTLPQSARAGLLSVAWNYGSLPKSVVEAVKTGDVQTIADAVEELSANPARRAKEAAIIRGSVGEYKRVEFQNVHTFQDRNGLWYAQNIGYQIDGKIRDKPVSEGYVKVLAGTLKAIDPKLGALIVSAGQDNVKRTGSHRHDVNADGEANTADFVLIKNGKKILPGEDKELYARVLEDLAAAGFTGLGHYSWGIHVGGGSRAYWGPDTKASSVDPVFRDAIKRGWARNKEGVDGDPKFAMVPYEARVAMQDDARTKIARENAAAEKEQKALHDSLMNALQVGIRQGEITRGIVEDMIASGKITDFDDMTKLDSALAKYQKDAEYAQEATAKLNSPTAVFDPTDPDDKKRLNAVVGDEGKNAIQLADQAYFERNIVPIVRKAQDIPTDVAGLLQGMVRSSDPKRQAFALDALRLLSEVAPDAYNMRIPDSVQSDVKFYADRKDRMPVEDLMRQINGGSTLQERQARIELRKEGEKLLSSKEYSMDTQALIAEFDGWFTREPVIPGDAWMTKGIVNDYRTLFLDEYERRGNADEAKTEALNKLKQVYGVSAIGGIRQLMKYPPQLVGYPEMADGYGYIDREVRSTLGLSDDESYVLISDDRTKQEFERFRRGVGNPPSYMIMLRNADGEYRPAIRPDTEPRETRHGPIPARMFFQPTQEDRDALGAEFDQLDVLNRYVAVYKEYSKAKQHQKLTGTPIPAEIEQRVEEAAAEFQEMRKRYPGVIDRLESWWERRGKAHAEEVQAIEEGLNAKRQAVATFWQQTKELFRMIFPEDDEAPEPVKSTPRRYYLPQIDLGITKMRKDR